MGPGNSHEDEPLDEHPEGSADEPDDERDVGRSGTRGPLPDPLDRVWLHPTELSSLGPAFAPSGPEGPPRDNGRRPRSWLVPLLAGAAGALLTVGVLALTGTFDRSSPSDGSDAAGRRRRDDRRDSERDRRADPAEPVGGRRVRARQPRVAARLRSMRTARLAAAHQRSDRRRRHERARRDGRRPQSHRDRRRPRSRDRPRASRPAGRRESPGRATGRRPAVDGRTRVAPRRGGARREVAVDEQRHDLVERRAGREQRGTDDEWPDRDGRREQHHGGRRRTRRRVGLGRRNRPRPRQRQRDHVCRADRRCGRTSRISSMPPVSRSTVGWGSAASTPSTGR